MDKSKQPFSHIGFIGLGVMGTGITKNLASKSGVPVLVWDAQSAAIDTVTSFGARAAANLADLAANGDFIGICLPSGAELEKLCAGDGGLLSLARAGQTFVDFGTSPVKLSRELAARFADRGAHYADAPIARGREAAQAGTLSITVGASPQTYAAIEPILHLAGTDVLHCGDVGCGQIVKIMNNMVLVQNVVALAEALATARAAGLRPEVLLQALKSGSADSYALRIHGEKAMWPGVFPTRAFSTRYALKDIGYALDLGEESDLDLKGAKTARELLKQTIDAGFPDEYWPVLLNVVQRKKS